ncbi:MAG: DNA-binding transcriptional LysR family regulator [Paraglaciecola sp.]|jgi:DNA-binding transcriptional LysR family regulator
MKRVQLNEMGVFIEVVRSDGFRAAAKKLNLGAGSISQSVQRLEDRLGNQLLNRTTRKVALTEAGRTLFNRCSPAFAFIEDVLKELDEAKNSLSGTLKINAPRAVGGCFLDDLLADYACQYPSVNIDIVYQDNKVDLVQSGVDAAIRIDGLLEKDTHAVPVGPKLDMAVVASPEYLKLNGVLNHPSDLTQHRGICYKQQSASNIYAWQFNEDGNKYSITPPPAIITNDTNSIIAFMKKHLGIGYIYLHDAQPYLDTGEFVRVLTEYTSTQGRYSINYLSKKNMPKRLRAFIDMALALN